MEEKMIGVAKQTTSQQVDIYDENGSFKFSKYGELVGYTSTTVSIKDPGSSRIDVYDENGSFKFSR